MYLDAALRWAQARDAHLRGETPEARHVPGLSELQQRLRAVRTAFVGEYESSVLMHYLGDRDDH